MNNESTPIPTAAAPAAKGSELIHISFCGPEYVIVVGKKRYRFEDSQRHGPTPLTLKGRAREFGEHHPFWDAHSRWCQTGKVVENGVCVYVADGGDVPSGYELEHIEGDRWRLHKREPLAVTTGEKP